MVATDPVELGGALERLDMPPDFKLSSMIDCGGLVQMVQQLMLALQKQTDRSDALEATVAKMKEEMETDREFTKRLAMQSAAQAAIQMSNGMLLDQYRNDIQSDVVMPAESATTERTANPEEGATDDKTVAADEDASTPAAKSPTVKHIPCPSPITPAQMLHPLRSMSSLTDKKTIEDLEARVAALEAVALEPGQWLQLGKRVNALEEVKPQISSRLDALEKKQVEHSKAIEELNRKLEKMGDVDKLRSLVDSLSCRLDAVELLESKVHTLQEQYGTKLELGAEKHKLLDAAVTALCDRVGMLEAGIRETGEHIASMVAPALDVATAVECDIKLTSPKNYCVDVLDCSLSGIWKLLWHMVSQLTKEANQMKEVFTQLSLAEQLAAIKDELFHKADVETFVPLRETDQMLTGAVDMIRTEIARLSACIDTKASVQQLEERASSEMVDQLAAAFKTCGQRNEMEILWTRVRSFEETIKGFTDLLTNGAQGDGERDLAALFRFPIRCLSCNRQTSPPVRRPSPPRDTMGVDNKPYKMRGVGNTVSAGSDAMWNVLGHRPQSARERLGVTNGFPRGRTQVTKGTPPAHLRTSPQSTRPSSARTVSVARVIEEGTMLATERSTNVPNVRGPTLANMQRLLADGNIPSVPTNVNKKPAFS